MRSTAFAAAALLVCSSAKAAQFRGEGTYYGGGGSGGACTQSWVPDGFKTVALNAPQYGGGENCGKCVQATVYNKETGTESFKAIIDNKCPECSFGDIDCGWGGSGRWLVEWDFIPCPQGEVQFSTQGSNAFYAKVKAEGGGAVSSISCNGIQGERSADNYFIMNDYSGGFGCGPTCTVVFESGASTTATLSAALFGGSCNGSANTVTTVSAASKSSDFTPEADSAPEERKYTKKYAPEPESDDEQDDYEAPVKTYSAPDRRYKDNNGRYSGSKDYNKKSHGKKSHGTKRHGKKDNYSEKFVCSRNGGLRDSEVCCKASCGKCGGFGCHKRKGGDTACCMGVIRKAAVLCKDKGAPPCILG